MFISLCKISVLVCFQLRDYFLFVIVYPCIGANRAIRPCIFLVAVILGHVLLQSDVDEVPFPNGRTLKTGDADTVCAVWHRGAFG